MDFKRLMTTICIFSMMLLFMQCEKEELFQKEAYRPAAEADQNPYAKKPAPSPEWAVISGHVEGEGYITTGENVENFELKFGGPFPTGTHTGYIRIMYSTKKHGENRIDFWYKDDGVDKCLAIRKANPNEAYVPEDRTLTLDIGDCDDPLNNCDSSYEYALIGWWEYDQPVHLDYAPALVTVKFSDTPPEE